MQKYDITLPKGFNSWNQFYTHLIFEFGELEDNVKWLQRDFKAVHYLFETNFIKAKAFEELYPHLPTRHDFNIIDRALLYLPNGDGEHVSRIAGKIAIITKKDYLEL